MITNREETTLAPSEIIEGVTWVAIVVCQHCGRERTYTYSTNTIEMHRPGGPEPRADLIRGVLTCAGCRKQTAFGMRKDAVDRYPAIEEIQTLPKVPKLAVDMLMDARMCFYGSGWRGTVAMARASVEEALEQRGHKGKLEDQIESAKQSGHLSAYEYMLAHGSRLAGNNALHRETTLDPSLVPAALSAALVIVNYLYR